jgi:hypothetical protein
MERKITLLTQAVFRAKEEIPTPKREAKLRAQFADPNERRNAMGIPAVKAAYYAILAELAQADAEKAAEAARRAGYD